MTETFLKEINEIIKNKDLEIEDLRNIINLLQRDIHSLEARSILKDQLVLNKVGLKDKDNDK